MTGDGTTIEAGWLSAALGRSLPTDAEVVAVETTSIGTGQVGENVRCRLTWNEPTADLPESVVVKLPSTSEISRSTAVQLDTYTKEVGFYRELQRSVDIRTPRLHALEWDADTHDFALLMEDIAPARQGDQLAGCDVAAAELAVDEAVGLHAPTWGDGRPVVGTWLAGPATAAEAAVRSQMLAALTPGFVERYGERLTADDLDLTHALAGAFPAWYDRVLDWGSAHGWCVVHGDYRLDNMLFGEPPHSPPLTVVDWQTVAIGLGPSDVAYFCGAGLLPEARADAERALVDRYAAALRDRDVALADADAWNGYVLGSVTGLYMAVLASQIVERTDRGDEMFAVMAERHLDQIRTVGLADLLDLA